MAKHSIFKFIQSDQVGTAAAEDDSKFLSDCFVDTGILAAIMDPTDARAIVTGRTGSGKSALLLEVQRRSTHHISIKPESLALAHISNSTILTFLQEIDVDLNIFFRLLWRHVFVVELLKRHFAITSQEEKHSVLNRIRGVLSPTKNEQHRRAIDYLNKWGHSFWKSTDYRTREVTKKLESELTSSIQSVIPGIDIGAGASQKLSDESKIEVAHRAQEVINAIQIRELSDIIELLKDVLEENPRLIYYVTIDRLDEDWVDQKVRLRLIKALIETVRDFGKIQSLKIVVALRYDLLSRMFQQTRSSGYQEEKYKSLYVDIRWSDSQLKDLVAKRLNLLITRRYTKAPVTIDDVLPERVGDMTGIEYILSRTSRRPRDVIVYLNECLSLADGEPRITAEMALRAEVPYSRSRLRSIADEWASDFPRLADSLLHIYKGRRYRLTLGSIPNSVWETFALELLNHPAGSDPFVDAAIVSFGKPQFDFASFKNQIVKSHFLTGCVGVKLSAQEPYTWSIKISDGISESDINQDIGIEVHPQLWRVLGIDSRDA